MAGCLLLMSGAALQAQTFNLIQSTDKNNWKQFSVKAESKASGTFLVQTEAGKTITTFHRWGTCFNELGWDALNMLPRQKQEEILKNIFSAQGDLKISMGRIPSECK